MDWQVLTAQLENALESMEIADGDAAQQAAFARFGQMARDLEAEAHRFRVMAVVATARKGEAASLSNLIIQLGNHATDAIKIRDQLSAAWMPTADKIRRQFNEYRTRFGG